MGWTDASGASYVVTGTATANTSSWTVYSAHWNGSTYAVDSVITPPDNGARTGSWRMVYQGNDAQTGPFDAAPSEYTPNSFPEIDGSALPKGALLVFSLYLFTRSRKFA